METLLQDLRYGLRMLVAHRGFTAAAIIALALGIGANTAIFSVVNAMLLRPLPYPNAERLVTVWEDYRSKGGPEQEWASPADLADWREQNHSFEHLSGVVGWAPTLTGAGEPQQLIGSGVSDDMFATLGVQPARGRAFSPDEDRQGEHVVILSDGISRQQFGPGIDPSGQSVNLDGTSYTVIGVMPPGFTFPLIPGAQVWTTAKSLLGAGCQRGCLVLRTVARLRPDVTLDGARADMSTIAARLAAQYPEENAGIGSTIIPLHDQIVGNLRPAILILLAAVAFVLLIACANVANLLLARVASRSREMAVRGALGASRWRIIRQLLAESVVLAAAGGTLGVLLAYWLVELLVKAAPAGTPRIDTVGIDWRVLAFSAGVTLTTGLVFGLIPAIHASRPDLNHALKEGSRGTQASARGKRIRGSLVVSEIALALMLLTGAGLLIRSFARLQSVDPGFKPDHLLTLNVNTPKSRYPEPAQAANFYSQLLERIRAVPGVQSVAATSSLPMSGNNTDASFVIEGRPKPPPNQLPAAWFNVVSPEYFNTMGIRLLRGREFSERDEEKAPQAVVIGEIMARRYFPDEDPIGKRIGNDRGEWREIIGVVSDVRHFGLGSDARPSMYFSARQFPRRFMNLVVRTQVDPSSLATTISSEVWALDKNMAVAGIQPMNELVAASVAQPRFILMLLVAFAVLALVLASVGIYGVMSYTVTERTGEIGIRMALGAGAGDVMRLALREGMRLALMGVGIGIAAALALTRLMAGLLFNVSATDPVTFAAITVLLSVVALIACYIPARRATRVDPMIALRYE